jgi:hypothetical protein
VPLYKKTFDQFKGNTLPPRPAGLEQAFVRFGVPAKQKAPARLAFDRSARQAGFFEMAGENRLVQPVVSWTDPSLATGVDAKPKEHEPVTEAVVTKPSRKLHSFIEGLLDELPATHAEWSVTDRGKWLDAAAKIFALIYKGDGEVKVTAIERGAHDKQSPS